jgi:hypothetical protein
MHKELSNRETMPNEDKPTTTRKFHVKRKRSSNEDRGMVNAHENASSDENQETPCNQNTRFELFQRERDEYILKMQESERKIKEQEKMLEEKQRIIEQQAKFFDAACSKMKQDFVCKLCSKIAAHPVNLPCSIFVCKNHLDNQSALMCNHCENYHDISMENFKTNRELEIRIALNEHLSHAEIEYKQEIELLLNETKIRTETLKDKETALQRIYTSYFSDIDNKIDAKRDELKSQVDEISSTLKGLVVQCKNLNEIKFSAYSLKKVFALDEIKNLECYLNEETRQVVFCKENFENLRRDLSENLDMLNGKLKTLGDLEREAQEFHIDMHSHALNFSSFGNVEYGYGFYNHLESLRDIDLAARGLENLSKYKNWEYKKFNFWPQSA